MSKITNDSLTRSGTGCFIAVPVWQQQWASKGYRILMICLPACDGRTDVQNCYVKVARYIQKWTRTRDKKYK